MATDSCVDDTTVVELTVTPAPKDALAPLWKLVPVTVTVRLAPGAPALGATLLIVGTTGTVAVALAVLPSAKFAVSVKLVPAVKAALGSAANRTKTLPSATAKLTAPLLLFNSAPSRLAAAPSAQFAVAPAVSHTPVLARSSSLVTVRAPLPAPTVTWKLPSSAPSALNAVELRPTLSRSLPRNARLSVGGGIATVNPPARIPACPSGFVTVTSRGPSAAVAPIAMATDSCVDDTTVVELTVTPAPKAAPAPGWKLVPVTVTVRLAPAVPALGATLLIVGTTGTVAVALAVLPSAKFAVSVKLVPAVKAALGSAANRTKTLPSATAKLTAPLLPFSSAPSRLAAAPSAQFAVAPSVSHTPVLARSSSLVTVRAPLPAPTVTWKLPSSAPSALNAVELRPTLSRSLPRNARLSVGGGIATVNPPARTPACPSGFVTVTSRGPSAAVAPIVIATDSCVDDTTVVELTVTPAPKAALAPGWKLVPVTVTVRLAPGAPVLGATLLIVGTTGTVAVALAVLPSAKFAVSVKLVPAVKAELGSAANRTKTLPSATAKLTAPLLPFSNAPSRLAAAPSAQFAVAPSVSHTPPAVRRSSSFVTVRAPLPAPTVTWKVPSSAPSALNAVLPWPTLSRSLPRNARLSVGGGIATANPPARIPACPSGFVTVTSRGPSAAVAPIAIATDSCVDDTTVVELTVTPAPKDALAPVWKLVPVTVTVRLAPGAPVLGATLLIVGTTGTVAVALAVLPSAKFAVSVKLVPPVKAELGSAANRKTTLPAATAKLTAPLLPFSSAPSRLAAAPSAQCAVAPSVSHTPVLARNSSFVTVRAPLPAPTVSWKLPSSVPSALNAVEPWPTLSRSLPRNARLSVGGGTATVNPPVRIPTCPPGFVTVTSRRP